MKTVLLADDEAHVRNVMAFKLKGRGFNVVTAGDGEEALELAKHSQPDLVVTDMQMPRMNGLELAQQMSREPVTASIPLIMVSSREFEIGPDEIRGTKIRKVMSKPFSPASLVTAVVELLGIPAQPPPPQS